MMSSVLRHSPPALAGLALAAALPARSSGGAVPTAAARHAERAVASATAFAVPMPASGVATLLCSAARLATAFAVARAVAAATALAVPISASGVAATTCSYSDWYDADLVVFFGSNPANDQPVSLKYLDQARRGGTRAPPVRDALCAPGACLEVFDHRRR